MKGENKLKTMLFLGIIISVVIAGSLSFIKNLATEYEMNPNLQSLNHSVEIEDEIKEAYELFENEENVQSNWLGNTIITGGKIIWSFITLIIKVPGMLGDLIHDLGNVLGIPPIFLAGASVLLLLIGIFALIEILSSGTSGG